MPTENQSPSYLRDREAFFRFVKHTPDGRLFKDHIQRFSPTNADKNEWEDGRFTDYETAVEEAQNGVLVMESCKQFRDDVENRRQGRSTLGLPGGASMHKIGQVPAWYYWRRIQETDDDQYWAQPKNMLWELLFRIPEYATVPRLQLMSEWEQIKPSTTKRFNAKGDELTQLEAKGERRAGSGSVERHLADKFIDLKPLSDFTGVPVDPGARPDPKLFLPSSVAPQAKKEDPCIVKP